MSTTQHCNGDLAEMQSIADMCGPQTDIIAERCARALAQRHPAQDIDIQACEAEFLTLING